MTANSRKSPKLVLASGSPRRRELLERLGLRFEVKVSDVDETISSSDPLSVVKELSSAKALAVGKTLFTANEETLVLGSDTIVVLGKDILGKPLSREDAISMLKKLSGCAHQVYTGVALLHLPSQRLHTLATVTDVYFRDLADAEISTYVDTGEPMDKAGAYALQGIASAFVSRVDGCFTNVIGLPVPDTVKLLREHGLEILGLGGANEH